MGVSLNHLIILWKARNNKVHNKTNAQERQYQLHQLKDKAQIHLDQQQDCRPSNHDLFPDNHTALLENSTYENINQRITGTTRAINNSIKQAAKEASNRTLSITNWFRPVKPATASKTMQDFDCLQHDSFSKKKQRKQSQPSLQSNRINGYFLSLKNRI